MSNFLASMIAMLTPSSISDGFLVAIATLFALASYSMLKGKNPRLTAITPNLLTSLGILGTFTGIVAGLMGFEPQNITESIPALLEGLKTAFLTSLFGMFFSILFKGIESSASKKEEDLNLKEVGPEEIYEVMSKQLAEGMLHKQILEKMSGSLERVDEVADTMNKQLHTNQELVKAIQGEEDASVVSQIRNMRTDINDASRKLSQHSDLQQQRAREFQEKLWGELKHFGDLLSKSATEQVINALKDVITDFNKKLTEQFGENFKRLDDSVKKLVDWQENYRLQLEDMQKKYQLGVDAIASTEQSVSNISEKAEIIPTAMSKLHDVMTHGHQQVIELEDRLKAFEEMRDKAVDAMPQIQTHLENTIKEIESSVKQASAHYTEMLDQSNRVISEYTKATTEGADSIKKKLTEGADELGSTLSSSAHDIGGKLVEASQTFETNAGEASSNMKTMNNELTTAAEQIRQELNDSMSDLNNTMRSLVTGIKEDAEQTSKTLETANIQLINDTKSMRDESTQAIKEMQGRLEGALSEVFQDHSREIKRTFDSIEKHLERTLNESGATMESQFSEFDKQMEEEVQRIVQAMGTNLATVTKKFTQDYTQLTSEMSKVVRSAQGVY
ncbi:hypothetical protein [Vibrio maritimus]|uniref:hypothetical protein n=1 Tax=Vibrio maritimus TaxID=990268 RepID=UPI003736EF79